MVNTILITGSTGLVGSHLLHQLVVTKKYKINCSIRTRPPSLGDSCIRYFYVEDLSSETNWSLALKGCETVIHLAARVHIMQEVSVNPLLEYKRVNVEGTLNLARQAIKNGVKRFIFISSIKVNGEFTTENTVFKADDLLMPDDPYAISKYEAEQGLLALSIETGLEVVIIRPPLIYGPGVKGNFESMMKWISRGVPLPLGNIKNKRSLVSVDNLVDLIMVCMDHSLAVNQIFLVSDGEDLSTTELLKKISASLGKPSKLITISNKLLNFCATAVGKKTIYQRLCGSLQVDISKNYELLGWSPGVKIDDALKATATYFLENTKFRDDIHLDR